MFVHAVQRRSFSSGKPSRHALSVWLVSGVQELPQESPRQAVSALRSPANATVEGQVRRPDRRGQRGRRQPDQPRARCAGRIFARGEHDDMRLRRANRRVDKSAAPRRPVVIDEERGAARADRAKGRSEEPRADRHEAVPARDPRRDPAVPLFFPSPPVPTGTAPAPAAAPRRALRRAPPQPQPPGARRRRSRSSRAETRAPATRALRRGSHPRRRESRQGAPANLGRRCQRRAWPRRSRTPSGRRPAETPPHCTPCGSRPSPSRQIGTSRTARLRSAAFRQWGRSRAGARALAETAAETSRTARPSAVDRSVRQPTTSSARRPLPSPDR